VAASAAADFCATAALMMAWQAIAFAFGVTHACLNFAALAAAVLLDAALAACCAGAAVAAVAPATMIAAADASMTTPRRRRAPGRGSCLVLSDPILMPAPS
jgi:hypothetical protein